MFDANKFLCENFGTARGLHAFVSAYGVQGLSVASTEKWFQRQCIPTRWFGTILAVMELDRGEPVSLVTYIRGRK